MSIIVETPFQNFTGLDGKPLTNGKVYIGQVGTDPTVFANQIPVFWDEALTIPASQPLTTNAGYIVRTGAPARVYANSDYSISVKNSSNILVYYVSSTFTSGLYSGPDGANQIGLSAPTSPGTATTVGAFLNNIHGIDVTLYGVKPDASTAANISGLNIVNALSTATGRPVYFPPIGTYKIGPLTSVTGSLCWYSTGNGGAVVQIDGDAWPYGASNAAMLNVTGSFRTHGLTWDQNWLIPDHAPVSGPYRDDMNPTTWGGYWFVRVLCSTTDVLEIQHCHFKNIARGFFAQAANTAVGGAASVVMTDCSGDSTGTAAQSVLAAEAPQSFQVANCWSIVTRQWDKGATYTGNGTSVVFPWGGTDIQIVDSRFVGYQLVCRGPASNAWGPNINYSTGQEYTYNGAESYRVVTPYTSGASFGVTDLANSVAIFNPMRKIQVCGNIIVSPIADTAIYGWQQAIIDGNFINNSGDMGIAASGTGYLSVSNNVIDSVRNGGIDVTYGGVANVVGNVVKDYARASEGVFQRIDTLNPGVFASNGGFNLAGITVGLTQEPGTKQVNITANNLYFVTLPPVSDSGPLNGGVVRAAVNGIYSQTSSNINAQNTINATGNTIQDRQTDMPRCYLAVATLRFYNLTYAGGPLAGDTFTDGAVKFVLVDLLSFGGFVFVRQFQGSVAPFGGQVFTGSNGATITVAANPQTSLIGSSESGNIDYTSKYIGSSPQNILRGQALVDPVNVAPGSVGSFTMTVSGALVGDYVQVAAPYQLQGLEVTAYISGVNTVVVLYRNGQGAAIDLGSGVWKAMVSKG